MRLPRPLVIASSTVAALAFLSFSAPLSAATPPPQISASPNHLMVNQMTTLHGEGFAPKATVQLKECASTGWIVVLHPCVAGSKLSVVTKADGSFTTSFVAKVCSGTPVGPATARRCFVGVPTPSGVDTMSLVGAVKLIVSYP